MIRRYPISLIIFLLILATVGIVSDVNGQGAVITPKPAPIILTLDATGNYTVKLSNVATVTGGGVVTLSPKSFNYTTLGNQTVMVTVTGAYNPLQASFNIPYGMVVDKAGNLFVVDEGSNEIRKIAPSGQVTTVAGDGKAGHVDGQGRAAEFNGAAGIAADGAGNLYIAESGDNCIRKIDAQGNVTTIAGDGTNNEMDGVGLAASFDDPVCLTVDKAGNIFVCDAGSNKVRKIDPAGFVTTVAVAVPPADVGTASFATSIAVDAAGNIFVLQANYVVEITTAKQVINFAGDPVSSADVDGQGTAAKFRSPCAFAMDAAGNLFVTEQSQTIRKVSPTGLVTTFLTRNVNPLDCNNVIVDAAGNLYTADPAKNVINKISPVGTITQFAGTGNAASVDNNNISAQATIPVTVVSSVPLPTVTIKASAQTICYGTQVTFTADTANFGQPVNYQWEINGVDFGTNSNVFAISTLYFGDAVTCVVTPAGNGLAQSTVSNIVSVKVLPLLTPTITISPIGVQGCEGSSFTFTAHVTNAGVAPTFQWQINNINVGTNDSTFTYANFNNGDQVKCILTNNTDCVLVNAVSSNSVKVVIDPNIPTSVAISAVGSTIICPGQNLAFNTTLTSNGGAVAYQWQVNGKAAGANSPVFSSTSFQDGDVITCVVTSLQGCFINPVATSNPITVSYVPNNPSVSIAQHTTNVCAGRPVAFTAAAANAGSDPAYQWQVNGTNAGPNAAAFTSTQLSTGDVVTCILTPNGSCVATLTSAPVTVQGIYPGATVGFKSNTVTINIGGSTTLSPLVTGDIASYSWIPATGLSDAATASPVATPATTTKYNLQVTTPDGCQANATVTVVVLVPIVVPNAFTPNGDGINDIWNIKGLEYYQCTVNIYDRYGTPVYKSAGYSKPWDGTCGGKALPLGVYYYLIDITGVNPRQLSGYVTIVR